MKYITLFETTEAYNAATLDLPNVSLIEKTMNVGYKPYVPETRLVCKYNVTDTNSSTKLISGYEQNIFTSMEIDGVMLDKLVTEYTFDTTGVHTVKYELYDETKLGNSVPVFYNNNLKECIIPDSVTNISQNAFNSCSSLTSITIPDSVTSIGREAFYGCSSLTSITIPDSVTSIDDGAFANTNALKVLNYNAKCELRSSFRGNWGNLETVIIGDSTPSIGNQVFIGLTCLTSVIIGSGVTSIGSSTFSGCSGLTSITIPDSVTSIGSGAFSGCSGLTSITIGSGVTSINSGAFNGCSGLTSITIPDSVTSIGSGAFSGCGGLTSITVDSNNTVYDSRNNCNAIIETTTNTIINGCKNTVIPSSVTSIGSGAFGSCNGLTSITIPDSVTSIDINAFGSCSGLTSITIPDSVTSIGNYAFYRCSSLISMTCNAITAPSIQNSTFQDINIGGTLTVPIGSTGYDTWMGTGNYYLGKYNWTKIEQ